MKDGVLKCGHHTERRCVRAVQLWNTGRFDGVIVTGGSVDGLPPAAPAIKQRLVNGGIPDNHIIIEDEATDTYENVVGSLFVLEELGFDLSSIEITVVSQWQHAYRFWLAFNARKVRVELEKLHYWMTLREYIMECAFIAYHILDPLGTGRLAQWNREVRSR